MARLMCDLLDVVAPRLRGQRAERAHRSGLRRVLVVRPSRALGSFAPVMWPVFFQRFVRTGLGSDDALRARRGVRRGGASARGGARFTQRCVGGAWRAGV